MNDDNPPSDRFAPDRRDDLEKLILRYPPPPADQRTLERLTARAMGRLRVHIRKRRARRRAVVVIATLASAAALVILSRWSWRERETPGDGPAAADRPITQGPGAGHSGPETAVEQESTPQGESPIAAVTRALQTAAGLRTSRREMLRELRRGGPEVVESLLEALKTGEGETALAAAQLLASIATSEADAAVRRCLEEGLADAGDGLPAEAARALVEELLRRHDAAGRRLVRGLLEIPSAGRLVVRQIGQGLWAADLLGEASASTAPALSSEAIGLLSQRRPEQAANAFWKAAESFAGGDEQSEPPPTEPAGRPEAAGLTAFLREALPRMSAASLAHLEDDLRRRARTSGTDRGWIESLAAALGRSGSTGAWPLLVAILETEGARPAVLRAFGTLGDERAVPLLERYVRLEDERAEAAIRSLAEIPDVAGVRALLSAHVGLGTAGGQLFPRTRDLLAAALRAREAGALAELRQRLADLPDQRTLGALIELFPGAAGDELAGLLESADRRARPQVFRALALLRTPRAVTVLIDSLEDPSLSVLARQSLAQIARRDLGPRPESWREWLREQDPESRRRADLDSGAIDPHRPAAAVLVLRKIQHHQEEA